MVNEPTEPPTLDLTPELESACPLDEIPRRGVDWDLFWNGAVFKIQRVDSPDERDGPPVLLTDDEAIAFVLYWACEPELCLDDSFVPEAPEDAVDPRYIPVQQECRDALRELVASWDPLFMP